VSRVAVAVAVLLFSTSCEPLPPNDDPCDPNPCLDPQRSQCIQDGAEARCACNEGLVPRPNGTCEAVTAANCPEHAGDSAEPDDCASKSQPLTLGATAVARTLEPVGDYDFFSFTAQSGNVYQLTVNAVSGAVYPRIDLFDAIQKHFDFVEYDSESAKAELGFRADASTKYYARVMHSPLDPSVATGGYSVLVADLGPDDHGNTKTSATPLNPVPPGDPGSEHTGILQYTRDTDWFVFSATSTSVYRVEFEPTQLVPRVEVYTDANFTLPAYVAEQAVFDLVFRSEDLTASGKVYLALHERQTGGAYKFKLTRTNR
jgi:hypothetical protein